MCDERCFCSVVLTATSVIHLPASQEDGIKGRLTSLLLPLPITSQLSIIIITFTISSVTAPLCYTGSEIEYIYLSFNDWVPPSHYRYQCHIASTISIIITVTYIINITAVNTSYYVEQDWNRIQRRFFWRENFIPTTTLLQFLDKILFVKWTLFIYTF